MSAFVLSGGYSRRFGTDKALYQYEGQSLIRYPLELLNEKFPTVSIVAKDAGNYEWLGFPVATDIVDQQTPLVGILSGMVHSNADWNYFQACDMPFMQPGIFQLLQDSLEEKSKNSELQAVIPLTDNGLQPLAAFYRKNTIDSVREAIHHGYSVKEWIASLRITTVNCGSARSFTNVNTVEDLNAVSA